MVLTNVRKEVAMAVKTRHRNVANPERAKAMHGLRSSNAAGTHADRRTARARSRQAARVRAIREAS